MLFALIVLDQMDKTLVLQTEWLHSINIKSAKWEEATLKIHP